MEPTISRDQQNLWSEATVGSQLSGLVGVEGVLLVAYLMLFKDLSPVKIDTILEVNA